MNNKVLIAEDNEFFSTLLKQEFEREGIDVVIVSKGSEVIEKIIENKPKVVFLDIIMPEKDGFEVLREIKSNKSLSEMVVYMFSSLGQEEDKHKALELGADDYIVKKDMSLASIVDAVKSLVK